ncbi:MAG TPA: HYR domain-containing protein, partial [Candidatus Thermoplasmatota archaeon]|nr:HYR domain-containing protein [Candidatus Thermoplasmatota archaeon]
MAVAARTRTSARASRFCAVLAIALLVLPSLIVPSSLAQGPGDDKTAACGELRFEGIAGFGAAAPGSPGVVFDMRITTMSQSERYVKSLSLEPAPGSTVTPSALHSIVVSAGPSAHVGRLSADMSVVFDGLGVQIPKHPASVDLVVTATLASGATPGTILDLQLAAGGLLVEKPGATDEACFNHAFNPPSGLSVSAPENVEPPALTLPENIGPLEGNERGGRRVTYVATALDALGEPVPVACQPQSGALFPVLTTNVACEAVDADGNRATGSFTVQVVDTTPPAFPSLSTLTVEAGGPSGATATFALEAIDVVDGPLPSSCEPVSGSLFPLGVTSVACRASDAAGNPATAAFDVKVVDTTPPTLAGVPAGVTLEATSSAGAPHSWEAPTSIDLVSGSVPVVCAPASGSEFPLGSTLVTCRATDNAGNTVSGTFTVTVRDTTKPILSGVPASVTLEATGPGGAAHAWEGPTAVDVVGGALSVVCAPASGSTFGLGTTTVTCSATDAAGNAAEATFAITVRDTTPPAITLPSSITLGPVTADGARADFVVKASDLVDGPVAVACTPASGSTFPLGRTLVTCRATDAAGNQRSETLAIVVRDEEAPVLTTPAPLVVEAAGPDGAPTTFAVTATDNVDGALPVACSPASGTLFPLGESIVRCNATDANGNTASASFPVRVRDATPPTIAGADLGATLEAAGPAGASHAWAAPSANDLVDGVVPVSCVPVSGSTFPLGATTVACSARDAAGNVATATFTVTVRDTTPPTLGDIPAALGPFEAGD